MDKNHFYKNLSCSLENILKKYIFADLNHSNTNVTHILALNR